LNLPDFGGFLRKSPNGEMAFVNRNRADYENDI